jgi:sulfite exporter TauE/SafE
MNHAMHHMPAMGSLSLTAAFVAGVAGSVHCVAMCGGISAALGMRARRAGMTSRNAVCHTAVQQAGRLASYTVAGGVCGGFGGVLAALLDLDQVALAVRILAGCLLIAMALRVLLGWRLLNGIESWGARFWSRIAPLARRTTGSGFGSSLLLGMLWGWLPCGLIYSMLMFATMSGSPQAGGATMLLFGLGTLPAMFGGGLIGARVGHLTMARGLNKAAGALLLVFGILTVLGPLLHSHH